MRGINKEFRPLIRRARQQGWTVAIGGRHLQWRDPSGTIRLVTSTSHGHVREIRNARARLRRAGLEV